MAPMRRPKERKPWAKTKRAERRTSTGRGLQSGRPAWLYCTSTGALLARPKRLRWHDFAGLGSRGTGQKRRPDGRRDGTNRGRLDEHQASRFVGRSPSPIQASSSTRPHRGTPATQRPPTPGPRRLRPPQPRAGRLAIQNPMPQPPAAARKPHPPERKGAALPPPWPAEDY
jgi:hypothetical protein